MKTRELHLAIHAAGFVLALAASNLACAQTTAPADTSGKALSCETLKQAITDKLIAKGVKNYQLGIVESAESTTAKVVGQCDGGKHKITYVRESGAVASK